MTLPILPAIVALLGLLTYVLSSHPKAAELGRLAFAVGLLVLLLELGTTGAIRLRLSPRIGRHRTSTRHVVNPQ